MKPLVEAALVGLARTAAPAADPGDAGDSLVARAADAGAERAFLLRLGVHAVRARAGVVPAAVTERPAAAPPDARPPCPPSLAAIVADLCAGRSKPILAEALERIDARGWRLPAQLTPALAALRDATLLPAAANVAGERGRWLARHNPAWRWLVDGVAPDSLEQRRRVWDEGSADARTAALRATRVTDPAEARDWVASSWQAEKASLREDMIAALATGLSADDEPLLVQALADRAAGVRQAAARLLARIDTSPLAGRARERADAVLAYAAPATGMLGALKSRLAGKGSGELSVSPPAAFVAAWADDGLVEKPLPGTGKRAFWLTQILSSVAPAHWEQRFGASADTLVKAATQDDEWADAVLAGWTEAAVRFDARPWAEPLWRARAARQPPESLGRLAALVFPLMDAAAIHDAAATLIDGGEVPIWSAILAAAPRPWSQALADRFLRAFRRVFVTPQIGGADGNAWRAALEIAAPALPIASLDQVLAIEPPPPDAPAGYLGAACEGFRSVLAIRKRIDQETRA